MAIDGELLGRRVSLADQKLRGREEIVETALLPLEHAAAVPFLSVLSPSANIRNGIDASRREPERNVRLVRGFHDGAVPAIPGPETRLRRVESQPLRRGQEHGDARPILRDEEHLFRLETDR